MREAGMRIDFQPPRSDSESLAASLPIGPGSRVLLPRGDLADSVLPEALAGRGALVTTVVAYRTEEAPPASIPLLSAALDESPVAIVVTSGSTVRGLLLMAGALGAETRVLTIPVVAIGPGTAAEATRLGFTVVGQGAGGGPGALADLVAAAAFPMAAV
jgi:uroporphyrinogen-III synthase